MRSVLAEALACVEGALEQETSADGVVLQRAPLQARRRLHDPMFDLVSAMPSGVRLAMLTDAAAIELDVSLVRPIFFDAQPDPPVFDLIVDDGSVVSVAADSQAILLINPLTLSTETRPAPLAVAQERPDERQDASISNPATDLSHQLAMVDPVEASLDVRLHDPLVVRGSLGVLDDLGDRVVGPPGRPVAVGGGIEVRLEDRFEHELEGHLDDPVPKRRDPEIAEASATLRDRPLADRTRPEATVLQLAPQLPKERLHPETMLDVVAGEGVDPGCA
jgi:hypothetical protein